MIGPARIKGSLWGFLAFCSAVRDLLRQMPRRSDLVWTCSRTVARDANFSGGSYFSAWSIHMILSLARKPKQSSKPHKFAAERKASLH
jgi:hypothetical protein